MNEPPSKGLAIIMPGLSGNTEQFAAMTKILNDHHLAVRTGSAILPGPAFGDEAPTVDQVAVHTLGELKTVEEPFVIVSHSVGVFVAAAMWQYLPENCRGVVAVNSSLATVGKFLDNPLREFIRRPLTCLSAARMFLLVSLPSDDRVKAGIAKNDRLFRLLLGKLVNSDDMNEETRAAVISGSTGSGARGALRRNQHHWKEFTSRHPHSSIPFLLVGGDQDPLGAQADLEEMARHLPGAEIRLLKGVRHSAPVEAPEKLADMVIALINNTD